MKHCMYVPNVELTRRLRAVRSQVGWAPPTVCSVARPMGGRCPPYPSLSSTPRVDPVSFSCRRGACTPTGSGSSHAHGVHQLQPRLAGAQRAATGTRERAAWAPRGGCRTRPVSPAPWCEEQLREENAEFVLLVCTERYRQRVEKEGGGGRSAGRLLGRRHHLPLPLSARRTRSVLFVKRDYELILACSRQDMRRVPRGRVKMATMPASSFSASRCFAC